MESSPEMVSGSPLRQKRLANGHQRGDRANEHFDAGDLAIVIDGHQVDPLDVKVAYLPDELERIFIILFPDAFVVHRFDDREDIDQRRAHGVPALDRLPSRRILQLNIIAEQVTKILELLGHRDHLYLFDVELHVSPHCNSDCARTASPDHFGVGMSPVDIAPPPTSAWPPSHGMIAPVM